MKITHLTVALTFTIKISPQMVPEYDFYCQIAAKINFVKKKK